jgi:formylglycine-generating enzyme required for sulfatase activity
MGEQENEKELRLSEYWIAKYPVSNAQFKTFVNQNGYTEKEWWAEAIEARCWTSEGIQDGQDLRSRLNPKAYPAPFNLTNHPVVGVTWYEALAFTRWLTAQWEKIGLLPKGWSVGLPNKDQWEKSGRGGVEIPSPRIRPITELGATQVPPASKLNLLPNQYPLRVYPWGDQFDEEQANVKEGNLNVTCALGCFPGSASPYGLLDLSGNVWEWTSSPWPDPENKWYVVRGGSYATQFRFATCSYDSPREPHQAYDSVGFRCVLTRETEE